MVNIDYTLTLKCYHIFTLTHSGNRLLALYVLFIILIGHQFWKGNKKIKVKRTSHYTMTSGIQGSSKTVKHFPLICSSSDDDFELPPALLSKVPPKKKMRDNSQIEDVLEKLKSIERSIEKLKENKDNPPSALAVGSAHQLREMLSSHFKCIICTMILHENSLIVKMPAALCDYYFTMAKF